MSNIGKEALVKAASKKTDVSSRYMKVAYECICEAIREQVIEGNVVSLEGLGRFIPSVKDAHSARNPLTGEAVEVPARLMVKFSVNNNLKLALREVDVDTIGERDGSVEEVRQETAISSSQPGKKNRRG